MALDEIAISGYTGKKDFPTLLLVYLIPGWIDIPIRYDLPAHDH